MQKDRQSVRIQEEQKLFIAPTSLIRGRLHVSASKYYTLRYVLAAALARGESTITFPAESDDTEVLLDCCRTLGVECSWQDTEQRILRVAGTGTLRSEHPVTLNVGNAGAVLRFLLGISAVLPEVRFVTDYPQSLGKRPNRELLEALTTLGAVCEGTGTEGYLPITVRGGSLHGGEIHISGTRSSQYLSALLFLAPLIGEPVTIKVKDQLKSEALVRITLAVLREADIVIEHDEPLRRFSIEAGQSYAPRHYTVPGDYPAAAALLSACAVSTDPSSEVCLFPLQSDEEEGKALLNALRTMGADLSFERDTLRIRGGRRLRGIEMDGNEAIDSIPVLVAAACFAEGESVFYNIEGLHYKESDRITDLCAELRKAGCMVIPQEDAIVVKGQPQGVEGGVVVDGHADHRVLMALAIVALRSRRGLTLCGVEHIAKSYSSFFEELQRVGVEVKEL